MKKKICVGIIGCGTVGGGTLEMLLENKDEIIRKRGLEIDVIAVADINIDKIQNPWLDTVKLKTKNADELINHPEIDIIVELVGGTSVAFEFVMIALNAGKHVVTANKALIAAKGPEIFDSAAAKNRLVLFEASVGGGIPIVRVLQEDLSANRILEIKGIVNGTCNYILTRMEEEGKPYAEIVADAQCLGYAEADPSGDIEGIDSANKMIILSEIAFGRKIKFDDIPVEGISDVDLEDMYWAKDLGYKIKLLGTAKKENGEIEVSVAPTMLPEHSSLATVHGVFNAVQIKGDKVGTVFLHGRGAGALPTASAVVADIIVAAKEVLCGNKSESPVRFFAEEDAAKTKFKHKDEQKSAFYVRLTVKDEVGVLASYAEILSKHGISVHSVLQRQRNENEDMTGKPVSLILIVHETKRKNLNAAIADIEKKPFICGKTICMRVERG